jgi:RimJ/RimL family protein N-acetyltransferase
VKPARGRPGAPVVGGRACLASSAEIAPAARTMTSARYASGPTLQEMTQPAMTPLTLTLRQGDVRRSLERGDVESIMRHARHTDMEQTYWLPGRPAVTAAAAEALVQEPTLGWDGSGPHGAALFIRRRDELVGVVSLRIESTRLELGYGVAPRFRDQGLATLATRLVIDWLVSTAERRRLFIRTNSTNRASCRVAEKLGCVPVRIDAGSAETEGEYVDALYEWPAESGSREGAPADNSACSPHR